MKKVSSPRWVIRDISVSRIGIRMDSNQYSSSIGASSIFYQDIPIIIRCRQRSKQKKHFAGVLTLAAFV